MFIVHLLVSLVIALAVAAVFVLVFRQKGPWGKGLFFLLLIFLFTWAGGIWVLPFGPSVYNVYWMPFVLSGLIVALIGASVAPPRREGEESETTVKFVDSEERKEIERENTTAQAVSTVFWALIVFLIAVIVFRYALYIPTAV